MTKAPTTTGPTTTGPPTIGPPAIGPPAIGPTSSGPACRVLLADDNTVYRTMVRRLLADAHDISVVASVGNGRRAIEYVRENPIDVVVLDIEMPIMDGLTALPEVLAADPNVAVIMASTLTQRNADISLRALAMGAAEYLTKPSALGQGDPVEAFGNELRTKIRALHTACQQRRSTTRGARAPGGGVVPQTAPATRTSAASGATARTGMAPARSTTTGGGAKTFAVRPTPSQWMGRTPKIVAIGSSTGGPRALIDVFTALDGQLRSPVLITQHMPPTFTKILAQHLNRCAKMRASEAVDGSQIEEGCIYVAPGDRHLLVRREGSQFFIRIDDGPPENFCKPSVNPMFRSVAKAYGEWALAVVLTGMGQDGATALPDIVGAGGLAIAQDQQSSVVWGMPQAAAATGLCSAILPLGDIPRYLRDHAMRHAA